MLETQVQVITLANGVSLELVSTATAFLGIGKVSVDGTLLRNGRRPMFVEIRNPSAVTLGDYQLLRQEALEDGVALVFGASRQAGGIMEWMVHEVRNRYHVADWTEEPTPAEGTELRLELRPVTRTLGGQTYQGFSYRYVYQSPDIPIYKILDRGTWEIEGQAVGSEFWMRNCFVPAIVPITSAAQFHSTEWYLPSCDNPNIFQFLPLQTELQGFSFTADEAGTLVTWASEVAHIRSLFEKPRGKDELVHLHEHCGDLGLTFATAPMEVLWAPGALDRVGRANAYEAVRELVHETLHAQLGMRQERVTTYGQIEEWGNADIQRYTALGVPKLLDAGVKTLYVANHFENNMNTWGVSNMCCTVDYKVAESVGEDNLRALFAAVRAGGARTEMWGNTSLSTLTLRFWNRNGTMGRINFLPREGSVMEVFSKTKDPFVRNASNAIEADHYTPEFAVMNLRNPEVRAYWHQRWQYAHDAVGLDGVFLDSSFNLSSDKFHWKQNAHAGHSGATADQTDLLGFYRPAQEPPQEILSMYRAHLELMTEMQQYGIAYCNEDLGVFGIHRHGPGITMRLDSLFLWPECIVNFDRPAIAQAGADPDAVFFKGLAYRMMWSLNWDIKNDRLSYHYAGGRGDFDEPTAEQLRLFKAYNAVNALMLHREILPEEAGVRYRGGAQQVLWAFQPLTLPLDGETPVLDVLTGTTCTVAALVAEAGHVYLIG